jgi:hypothetical protein
VPVTGYISHLSAINQSILRLDSELFPLDIAWGSIDSLFFTGTTHCSSQIVYNKTKQLFLFIFIGVVIILHFEVLFLATFKATALSNGILPSMGGEAPKTQDTVKGENKSSRPQPWRKFFASQTESTPRSRRSSSATRSETPSLLHRSLKRFMGDDLYSKFCTHLQTARSHLPRINFITVHYTYFITTCLITSLIFWGSSHPSKSISYTDSLFLVISAMTEAGLNTVDLSTMTTFQQVLLWLLIIFGSAVFVSISTILTRKRYFELRFKHVVEMQKASRRTYRLSLAMSRRTSTSRGRENDGDERSIFERIRSASRDVASSPGKTKKIAWNLPVLSTSLSTSRNDAAPRTATSEQISPLASPTVDHITFAPDPETVKSKQAERNTNGESSSASTLNEQAGESSNFKRRGKDEPTNEEEDDDAQKLQHWEYPSYLNKYTTGHNAQFHGLTKAEREHLGGVEYQAISLLAWIVPIYWILWQFLGGLGLALYFGYNKASVAEENGINPWYVIFWYLNGLKGLTNLSLGGWGSSMRFLHLITRG